MGLVISGGAAKMMPGALDDYEFELDTVERTVVISEGSTVQQTNDDAVVNHAVASVTENAFDLVLTGPATALTQTPLTVTVGETGLLEGYSVSRVSDGACEVIARSRLIGKRATLTFLRTSGASDTWLSWVDGSLAKHLESDILSRLTGHDASDLAILANGAFLPGCWASGIDWSPLRAIEESYKFTVISPRHILGAEHVVWMPPEITFIGSDGVPVTRSVTAHVEVGPTNASDGMATDLRVGLLDSALPATVTPVSICPADLLDYLPNIGLQNVPCVCVNQFAEAFIGAIGDVFRGQVTIYRPTDYDWLTFSKYAIPYDSGAPVFLVINGQLCLLGVWSGGGSVTTCGVAASAFGAITEINAAMTTLGGGYQLTVADLTEFTNYG